MKIKLISKTFSLAVLAGIISSLLSPTLTQAQTTPKMQTMPNNIVSQSTTPEQIQYHQTLGQMQQMLRQMQQQVEQMTPEQLQQNRQQLEQMMKQMQQMSGQ
ncbi:hypothetical protein [Pleurocapsa sp. FMAR1]|uniref:hypothetical protein n=1 Tax=Pleurocapsa sp. FMAR1 TaxID=3040204 RepID=UPI0029C9602A|nr:hypothetical protein [Pleurocapsa sp. FMAR1]